MTVLSISQPQRAPHGSGTIVSTKIQLGTSRFDVWYRVSDGSASNGAESFLIASIVPAMKLGCTVEVESPISSRLLQAIPRIQNLLHRWYPHLRPVTVRAEPRSSLESAPGRGLGCFFSGGVDSLYSVVKHHEKLAKGVVVNGFDVSLERPKVWKTVSGPLREGAAALGRPLIEVDTNIRSFGSLYAHWGYEYHGTILASVAQVLAPQLHTMIVPSSYPFADLFPWGSHPDLDPQFSTEAVEVLHDGCDRTRVQKVAAIAQCDAALNTLRVCWHNKRGGYNCGKCEKCLRTMVDLRIVGALERCTTFQRPIDLGAVARIDIFKGQRRLFYKESLKAAEEASRDPELIAALRACLAGEHYQGFEGFLRRCKSRAKNWIVRPMMRPFENTVRWVRRSLKRAG